VLSSSLSTGWLPAELVTGSGVSLTPEETNVAGIHQLVEE
jgi:hypothetical protein